MSVAEYIPLVIYLYNEQAWFFTLILLRVLARQQYLLTPTSKLKPDSVEFNTPSNYCQPIRTVGHLLMYCLVNIFIIIQIHILIIQKATPPPILYLHMLLKCSLFTDRKQIVAIHTIPKPNFITV